jgi:hypothetical protein
MSELIPAQHDDDPWMIRCNIGGRGSLIDRAYVQCSFHVRRGKMSF